jgi:hypothetical protein
MPIHHVFVAPDIADTLSAAAQDAGLTTLDFAAWVLDDWARNWRVKDDARRAFTAAFYGRKEATHAKPV